MVIERVSVDRFKAAFHEKGCANQFTDKGLKIIFDHMMYLSDVIGENLMLDVIDICCNYTEKSMSDFAEEHGMAEEEIDENFPICGSYENEQGLTVYVFEHS